MELDTVQSSVTGCVRTLELELGTRCLTAHGGCVSPARAAQRLTDARTLDDGASAGPFVLGYLENHRRHPSNAAGCGACPKFDLSIRTGTTFELIEDALCSPTRRREARRAALLHWAASILGAVTSVRCLGHGNGFARS